MLKIKNKSRLYDRLHRGSVWTLMGLTVFGGILASLRVYRFFTVVRPRQAELNRMMAEDRISQEQGEKEFELLEKQKQAEHMM